MRTLAGCALLMATTAGFAEPTAQGTQQPRLINGRLETHVVSAGLAKDLPALARTLTEPAWIGYAMPMIDGNHHMCDDWSDGRRATFSTAPVHLEAPGYFLVLFRIEDRQVARVRTYSADCPLDASGKTVHWFTTVTAADSLAYLTATVSGPSSSSRIVDSAVTAIAMHAGQPALDRLVSLARNHDRSKVRSSALFWLAQRAGEKAAGTITDAIENDPDTDVKKRAVFALSQLPKDEGVPLLIQQAR